MINNRYRVNVHFDSLDELISHKFPIFECEKYDDAYNFIIDYIKENPLYEILHEECICKLTYDIEDRLPKSWSLDNIIYKQFEQKTPTITNKQLVSIIRHVKISNILNNGLHS